MSGKESVKELESLKLPVPKPGVVHKAVVVGLRKGKLKELVNIERIRNENVKKRFMENAEREALQVEFEVEGIVYRQTFLWSLHPKSNLVALIKKYGELKKGMEIEVVFNQRGYPRINLE